jgi:hypothetical protein
VGGSGPSGNGAPILGAVGVDKGCQVVGDVARIRQVVVVSTFLRRVDNWVYGGGWGVEDASPM